MKEHFMEAKKQEATTVVKENDIEAEIAKENAMLEAQKKELADRKAEVEKNKAIIKRQNELTERQAAVAKETAEVERAERELIERQRIAAVRARQIEVDEREEALAEQDKIIENFQSGKKALPGQRFIDSEGRQHSASCNSHPSKRTKMQCDCGKNGTARYKNQ